MNNNNNNNGDDNDESNKNEQRKISTNKHVLSFSIPLLKNCEIQTNMKLTGNLIVKKRTNEQQQRNQFVQFST